MMPLEAPATQMPSALTFPDLEGKRVLLTGVLEPDCAILAHAFAHHRCRLVLQLGLAPGSGSRLAEEIRDVAGGVRVLPADLATIDGIDRFADAALRTYGGLDVMINVSRLPQSIWRATSDRELVASMTEALRAPLGLSRRAVDTMRQKRTGGVVINVLAGTAPVVGPSALAVHAFAKTALERVTQGEAIPAYEAGVRVYGLIEAKAEGPRAWPSLADGVLEASNGEVLDSIASAGLFLASDRGRWLNGATLAVGA